MLLLYLSLVSCARVETAPAAWPSDGCAAAPSGGGSRLRSRWFQTSDGVHLALAERVPDSDCAPAVIVVPPGFQAGRGIPEEPQARALAEAGVRVLSYDPRGRGASGGEEDAGGPRAQDDLAEIARWLASQPGVDPRRVVIDSRSFGAVTAAGALARHADLAARAWFDYEGPARPSEELPRSEGQSHDHLVALAAAAPDPEAWWAAREPANFVAEVAVPYHRFQGIPDHALGEYVDHARTLIDLSGAASVRFNEAAVEPPIGEDQAWTLAVDGGLEPDDPLITDALVAVAWGGEP